MTPQPQAGTETAETSEKLLNTYFMKVVGYCNAQDYDTMDACEAVEAEILSHIAAKDATITAQAAAISELVEELRTWADAPVNGTPDGVSRYWIPHSNIYHSRALVAKYGGAA